MSATATLIHRPTYVIHWDRGREVARKLRRFERAKIPSHIYPLDMLRVSGGEEAPCEAGVYFLWRGPQLLYIGQSYNLYARIYEQERTRDGLTSRKKRIPFDCTTYFLCPSEMTRDIELQYILAYRPPYNDSLVR